ncbi:MAG: pyridoxamine 5'-phosphate oxidase family protein [Spirochaetes bacterium]|jgi:general stress protein 26|nr:pyridoxamine 5'-phosphate oxidase family protein [Spirochaetota bacterium]
MTRIEKSMAIIASAPVAVLTTLNSDGYPESRALLNLRNSQQYPSLSKIINELGDGNTLIFTTNTNSAKISQINNNNRVSIYYCLSDKFKGVWVSGDMELILDSQKKAVYWQQGWEMYYPGGKFDPDYSILRLNPIRIRLYENLSVAEWSLS